MIRYFQRRLVVVVVVWGGHQGGRTAVESCFKEATNLHSLHVIKHDITVSPGFTQEVPPAGTTHKMTTSEMGRGGEKLSEAQRRV